MVTHKVIIKYIFDEDSKYVLLIVEEEEGKEWDC